MSAYATTQDPSYHANNPSTASKIANLEPDIILLIADQLVDSCLSQTNLITRHLLLINKHWNDIMMCHPSFRSRDFTLWEPMLAGRTWDSIDDIEGWLSHPNRRQKRLRHFSISFDPVENMVDYDSLCGLLDNQLSDVKFNVFEVGVDGSSFYVAEREPPKLVPQLHFPGSLKAHHLILRTGSGPVSFRWAILGQSLREEVRSIEISGDIEYDSLPENYSLKSLRKLEIEINSELFLNQFNEFLQRHTQIRDLIIVGHYGPSTHLPLVINPLRKLEHLSVQSIEADHDLFNPAMFYKFANLKYFEYQEGGYSQFSNCFNSGLYDQAMPLIEELVLRSQHMSKEALHRYINSHKHLRKIAATGDGCYVKNDGPFYRIHDTAANKSIYVIRNAT